MKALFSLIFLLCLFVDATSAAYEIESFADSSDAVCLEFEDSKTSSNFTENECPEDEHSGSHSHCHCHLGHIHLTILSRINQYVTGRIPKRNIIFFPEISLCKVQSILYEINRPPIA